jgi:hypothetical protein
VRIEERFLAAVGELRGVQAADGICQACVTLLDVEAAAISLMYDGSSVATLGASSVVARLYEEVQFTVGEGPCLDSVARRAPVVVVDLADPEEFRWPLYRPAMLAHHIRGVAAIPVMVAGECVGALDLFQMNPVGLHGERMAGALLAADLTQLPLLDLLDDEVHGAATDFEGNPWVIARTEVAQATGMLMAQLGIGPVDALVRLRAHAYATDTSATQIARAIIDRRLRFDRP